MRSKFAMTLLFLSALSGCTRTDGLPPEIPVAGQSSAARPAVERPAEKDDRELEQAIAKIAEAAQGKVGVGAVLVETGDAAYLNREQHFAMQSVYKLPIAMAMAQQVDKGALNFDSDVIIRPTDYVRRGFHSPIRNMYPQGTVMRLDDVMRYSISESDGSANDVVLRLAGGPEKVEEYLKSIGITDMVVADSTKTISMDWDTQYQNWATPAASVDLLRKLFDHQAGLSESAGGMIYQALSESETGRHRIRKGMPPGSTLAHKTGTGGHPSEVPGYRQKLAEANSNNNVSRTVSSSKVRATATPKPTPPRGKKATVAADSDSEEGDTKTSEVISAVNDIGIITLPDGRHIILAVYINDSVADSPTREHVIAEIAKAVCDKWTTGQLPDLREYSNTGRTR
jgi:beta-lactamase class A